MNTHAPLIGITVVALWATVACPQLRDDDFEPRLGDLGGGGATAGAGVAGGDGDGGPGSAGMGAAGGGGSSMPPLADSGTEPGPTVCRSDEVTAQDGACYFVDSAALTWAEARRSCQARGNGWDLVTIGNTTQNDLVASSTGFEAWIGATDAVDEGRWLWVNEDAPFFEVDVAPTTGFSNWSDGEPNNYDGSDCLRILTTGQWADWPCDSTRGFVCGHRAP